MNWQDKEKIKRALLDVAAFLLLCFLTFGFLALLSGCTSAPATTVDNTTVTTEVTRTEYAPDGSVSAVEVHKEVVKSDVVVSPDGEKKTKKVPLWLLVLLVSGAAGGSWYLAINVRRRNL